ncbi:hypothetical protein [Pyrinomonas sp.]|uniref:hypothetical protein n=1 Tax=Pyrinomonas sp. TaxID=2080306 RepID=UPI003333A7CC
MSKIYGRESYPQNRQLVESIAPRFKNVNTCLNQYEKCKEEFCLMVLYLEGDSVSHEALPISSEETSLDG